MGVGGAPNGGRGRRFASHVDLLFLELFLRQFVEQRLVFSVELHTALPVRHGGFGQAHRKDRRHLDV